MTDGRVDDVTARYASVVSKTEQRRAFPEWVTLMLAGATRRLRARQYVSLQDRGLLAPPEKSAERKRLEQSVARIAAAVLAEEAHGTGTFLSLILFPFLPR